MIFFIVILIGATLVVLYDIFASALMELLILKHHLSLQEAKQKVKLRNIFSTIRMIREKEQQSGEE